MRQSLHALLLIVSLIMSSLALAEIKPNVIFMMADDMGMGDTSAYQDFTGNADDMQLDTPSMDRLARMGVRFTDAHSPSSRCTPSRYGLLTGRDPWRTRLKHFVLFGSQGDPLIERDRPTLGTLFASQGYTTAMIGKWHVGLRYRNSDGKPAAQWDDADLTKPLYDCPLDHGFDVAKYTSRSHGTSGPMGDPLGSRGGPGHLEGRKAITAIGPRSFATSGPNAYILSELGSRHSDHAIEFLNAHATTGNNAGKPFFLYYAFNSNHTPYTTDQTIGGKPVKDAGRFKDGSKAGNRLDYVYENDVAVERILDWLENHHDPRNPGHKMIETTVVIFTSDNGADKPAKNFTGPFRSNKASCYEAGHRVPFIVAWAKGGIGDGNAKTPGLTNQTPLSLTDMYATFAQLIGIDLPDLAAGEKGAEDSISVLAAWRGKQSPRTTPMFYNDHKEARPDPAVLAMRLDNPWADGKEYLGQWKLFFDAQLLRRGQARPTELYELSSDPMEANNRIDDAKLKPLLDHLVQTAIRHRSVGGHRLVTLPTQSPVTFDWVGTDSQANLSEQFQGTDQNTIEVVRQGLKMTVVAKGGENMWSIRESGLGIQGGASERVDSGEAIAVSFDHDVIVQSVSLFAGSGACGGFYRVGNAAPLSLYCIDADQENEGTKDQSGIMADIGVLKAGDAFTLDSNPHEGADASGSWTLQSITVRPIAAGAD